MRALCFQAQLGLEIGGPHPLDCSRPLPKGEVRFQTSPPGEVGRDSGRVRAMDFVIDAALRLDVVRPHPLDTSRPLPEGEVLTSSDSNTPFAFSFFRVPSARVLAGLRRLQTDFRRVIVSAHKRSFPPPAPCPLSRSRELSLRSH